MRIAWFTPFSRQSGIGRCSSEIVRHLSQLADVHVWHPETNDLRETDVTRRAFTSADSVNPQALAEYDLLVYNLGNYLPFHGEIYRLSQRFPGLCILHDFVMHHFFSDYYLERLRAPRHYVLTMKRLYGEHGRRTAEGIVTGKRRHVCESEEVLDFPFFEEAIRGAYGVITHAEFLRQRVERVFAGPVARFWLPYEPLAGVRVLSRSELGVPEDGLLLVTVGHVNPNKRIHVVIDALGRNPGLTRNLTYAVLGPADPAYQNRLTAAVKAHKLERVVRFLGYVSDEVLHSYITHAGACVNLRYPAMEGASGSAIEEMMQGKAMLVTDTGSFAELPDDCVIKVNPAREQDEVAAGLTKLVMDGELREALGKRAAEFAQRNFRPETYARNLVRFAREVLGAKPLLQLSDRLAGELTAMGVNADMEIVETVSRECCQLFCSREEPGPEQESVHAS